MRKFLIILSVFLFAVSFEINAQIYQFSNGGFENWEGSGDYREPVEWNSFMTANCVVPIGCSMAMNRQIEESSDTRPGSTGHSSCKIWAKSVFGVIANGCVTSGRMYMGSTTPTSSSNYNYTERANSNFCRPFNGKPDSLVFWAKSFCSGQAKFALTIHDDYDYRDPQTSDGNAGNHVVGMAVKLVSYNDTWKRYSVPISYDYPANVPKYALLNVSTNQNGGQGQNNESLYIDDIEFIYNCEVADIKLNGTRIENFNPSTEIYNIDVPCGSNLDLNATSLSVGANILIEQATISNNYTATITITNGDKTRTIIVYFHPQGTVSEIVDNICQGQNYNQNGFNLDNYESVGTFNESISVLNSNDCYDITNLTLSVNPRYETNIDLQICSGQEYDFYGTAISEAGVYQKIFTTIHGCDSIINLNLSLGDSYTFNYVASICEGETYNDYGFNASETGEYSYSIITGSGCDSVFNLFLTVNESYNETVNISLCEGNTYNWNGEEITEAGVYTAVFQSNTACDSVVNLFVTLDERAEYEITEEIYRQQRYIGNGFDIFDTDTVGSFTYELFDTLNCEYKILNLIIKETEKPTLETSSDFIFTVFPNPAKTYITIEIEKYEANDINYIIHDMHGNVVLRGVVIGDSFDINTSSLQGGIYNLKLYLTEEFTKSTKIIIR